MPFNGWPRVLSIVLLFTVPPMRSYGTNPVHLPKRGASDGRVGLSIAIPDWPGQCCEFLTLTIRTVRMMGGGGGGDDGGGSGIATLMTSMTKSGTRHWESSGMERMRCCGVTM